MSISIRADPEMLWGRHSIYSRTAPIPFVSSQCYGDSVNINRLNFY